MPLTRFASRLCSMLTTISPQEQGEGREASPLQTLDRDVAIGVDADVGGDVERAAHDLLGVERLVEQRARGGERVVAAGADAHDVVLRLEYVAGAGEHERDLR